MSLGLHNLRPARGSKKRRKRVGRGNASGHGTYSTRGLKGQRSRSGGRKGLKVLGMKQRILKIPKLRGFKSRNLKMEVVNLRDLDLKFSVIMPKADKGGGSVFGWKEGEVVTPQMMLKAGLVRDLKRGVKILGDGKLTKKLTVRANMFSASARDGIIKAGGEVELIVKK